MNKFLACCFILFIIFPAPTVYAQQSRIDLTAIENSLSKLKTNGDVVNYLKNEINKVQQQYGRESVEYVDLKRYYLDQYWAMFQSNIFANSLLMNEYVPARREIMELSEKVNGGKSYKYATDIQLYTVNVTVFKAIPLTIENFNNTMALIEKAIQIAKATSSVSKTEQAAFLSLMYGQKGELYRRTGRQVYAIQYYEQAVEVRKDYPTYDDYFPSLLTLYAQMVSISDLKKAIGVLEYYLPTIEENYRDNKAARFRIYHHILMLNLRNNYVDDKVWENLNKAEGLCREAFDTLSIEYTDFLLNVKLQAYKKAGWKAENFQVLAHLEYNVFKNNPKLLTDNEKFFVEYCLEWYYFYKSVSNNDKAIMWIKWADGSVSDTVLYENSFNSKKILYRELALLYEDKDPQLSLVYHTKGLHLEKMAKERWGAFSLHQYQEIARYYFRRGDAASLDSAYRYCQLSLDEFANMYGRESFYYKNALFTLGQIEYKRSNGKKGYNFLWPHVYAQFHDSTFIPPLGSNVFQTYANILNEQGKSDSADLFYRHVYIRNPAATFFRLSGTVEKEQARNLDDLYLQNSHILNEHFKRYKQKKNKMVLKELADQLFQKNLIFLIQGHYIEALQKVKTPQDKAYLMEYNMAKRAYDSLLYTASQNHAYIDSIYTLLDWNRSLLVESLIANSADDSTALEDIRTKYSYKRVQKILAEKECFVDIIRFQRPAPGGVLFNVPTYALVVIDKNSGSKIEYIFIENAGELDQLIREVKYNKLSSELSPLIQRLKNYDRVFVHADGIFNLLNFYALKDEHDQHLIEKQTFVYVNSIEGIMQKMDQPVTNKKAIFFGNPIFATNRTTRPNGSTNHIFSNTNIDDLGPLPYTKIEIEKAASAIQKKGWKTTLYTENKCNEEDLKKERNANIIHIATHGFYLPASDTIHQSYAIKDNPYLRSGLVLGTLRPTGNSLNDNVLTAYEVMNMDLRSTSLVILSACETAKGSIISGQGIYGIQRAFKVAGARYVIVSVRKVDDKATQLLMEYFYSGVADGENYISALRNAQLKMMHHPLFGNPEYWSHFILIGR